MADKDKFLYYCVPQVAKGCLGKAPMEDMYEVGCWEGGNFSSTNDGDLMCKECYKTLFVIEEEE